MSELHTITLRVRDGGGTYTARGGGKVASATAGENFAANALASKLFKTVLSVRRAHTKAPYGVYYFSATGEGLKK